MVSLPGLQSVCLARKLPNPRSGTSTTPPQETPVSEETLVLPLEGIGFDDTDRVGGTNAALGEMEWEGPHPGGRDGDGKPLDPMPRASVGGGS